VRWRATNISDLKLDGQPSLRRKRECWRVWHVTNTSRRHPRSQIKTRKLDLVCGQPRAFGGRVKGDQIRDSGHQDGKRRRRESGQSRYGDAEIEKIGELPLPAPKLNCFLFGGIAVACGLGLLLSAAYGYGLMRWDGRLWLGLLCWGCAAMCALGFWVGLFGVAYGLGQRYYERHRKYFHNQRLNQRLSLDKPKNLT